MGKAKQESDRFEKEGRLDIMWLDYKDLIENKTDSISRLLKFYGIGASEPNIQKMINVTQADERRNRFNKGISGRGDKKLTDIHKKRIMSLIKYYPQTDFGRIGL